MSPRTYKCHHMQLDHRVGARRQKEDETRYQVSCEPQGISSLFFSSFFKFVGVVVALLTNFRFFLLLKSLEE